MSLFGTSPTGRTRRRIFTRDIPNDLDSRKDVPFWGLVYIALHLGGQTPQNIWLMVFSSQTPEIEKRACYQTYCFHSNQILHSDKDHQNFRGWSQHTHYILYSRWRTAAILEKSKNCYISAAFQPILTKFGIVKHFEPLDRLDR